MLNSFVNQGTDKLICESLVKSEQTKESDSFEKDRVIKISGHPATLDKIEKMLAYMERLGKIGHSTTFEVGVDGDGGFVITCVDKNAKELSKKWLDEISNPDGKDIKYFSFE